jgi:hypothetical protein
MSLMVDEGKLYCILGKHGVGGIGMGWRLLYNIEWALMIHELSLSLEDQMKKNGKSITKFTNVLKSEK